MMKRAVSGFLSLMLAVVCLLSGCSASAPKTVLHVALPYSDNVQDPETNYYIGWLEEKTGLDLEITTVQQAHGEDYLEALFSSDADMDVVMFGEGFTVRPEIVLKYVESGDIAGENGAGYFVNTGKNAGEGTEQVLWINYEWLNRLGLEIPGTTDELRSVLEAFRWRDPNGDGEADEIALLGCTADYVYSPVEYLLNSFVCNDPYHSRYAPGTDEGQPLAFSEEFREGLRFCHELFEQGLIDPGTWKYERSEFTELVNSPLNLVGAFTTGSISDVIYQGNPEIMARYVHVAPIEGPGGVRNALYVGGAGPGVGAVITGRSSKKQEARLLLSTMLTEEASLIARYGEQGVDWEFSDGSDVSIYGDVSLIVTRQYLWNTSQNKHLNGIGPMDVPERYIRGILWNGVNSDAEYIDARARMSCREFIPDVSSLHERDEKLSAYLDSAVEDFVIGRRNIGSDREWEDFVNGQH